MQDFTKLQTLCEKHKVITDIIHELEDVFTNDEKFIINTKHQVYIIQRIIHHRGKSLLQNQMI